MSSFSSSTNVRQISSLKFSDHSTFSGQILDGANSAPPTPFGWGILRTAEGFQHSGYFKAGKSVGEGKFQAPNGDCFYGSWSEKHKRDGKGLFVRGSDGLQLVEEWADGALVGKRVKRRAPAENTNFWHHGFFNDSNPPAAAEAESLPSPGPRCGCSLTVFGSMIILIGGETAGGTISDEIWIMDVASRRWTRPSMKGAQIPPISNHTATLWKNQLILIGGQSGGLGVNSGVFVLDLDSGVWSNPIQKGLSFVDHSASLIGDVIYVIVQSSVFTLAMKEFVWKEIVEVDRKQLKKTPRSFISHTATAVGNKIYVFGGKILGGIQQGDGKKYEKCTAELRIFDTRENSWECVQTTLEESKDNAEKNEIKKSDYSGFVKGSFDTPRCDHTASLIGDSQLLIVGGWTSSNPEMNKVDESHLNDVQILNTETLQWQRNPVNPLIFPVPRSAHSAVQVGTELWIFGGRNSAADQLEEWNRLNIAH